MDLGSRGGPSSMDQASALAADAKKQVTNQEPVPSTRTCGEPVRSLLQRVLMEPMPRGMGRRTCGGPPPASWSGEDRSHIPSTRADLW
jgi:hypothetical protein